MKSSPPRARLILQEPFKAGRQIDIGQVPFLIGRDDDCQLTVSDSSVSGRHARIIGGSGCLVIQDLQSKNGTFVNGNPIGECPLKDGDLLSLGGLDLLFCTITQEQWAAQLAGGLDQYRRALQVTTSIRAQSALDAVLDEVMSGLVRLTQAERGLLLLRDEEGVLKVVRRSDSAAQDLDLEGNADLSSSAAQRAVQGRTSVVVSNASGDTFFRRQTSIRQMSLKTIVCVPVKDSADQVIGLLYADSSQKARGFTALDVEVLESLASGAAIALENRQVFCELRQLVREAAQALSQVEKEVSLDETLRAKVRTTLVYLRSMRPGREGRHTMRP